MDRTQIIEQAFGLVQAVAAFAKRARLFFYAVVIAEHRCPQCEGRLSMYGEAWCVCRSCGQAFDPTVAFQTCMYCGGRLRLRVRRYECAKCGTEVASRFLFDGLAFDADYFRQKMAEYRQRKAEQRDRVRQMLAESRSDILSLPGADLSTVPGLADALNQLTTGFSPSFTHRSRGGFDLHSYQRHIQAHLQPFAISLEEIPPLGKDTRLDRVWRFIAVIFLAHSGVIDIWQNGQAIMVIQREIDRKGQELPGDLEEADGIEGSLGRVEA